MKIRFKTTMDDLVAFNRFHTENSPTMRRQRLGFRLMVPAILAMLGFFAAITGSDGPAGEDSGEFIISATAAAIVFLPLSAGWFIWSRRLWIWAMERNARKLYAEGINRTMLGWREMELVGNRLRLETAFTQGSTDLRAIDKIVANEDYTFVYIDSVQAYLIPMSLYPEEEYRQFVAELREAWENRDALPPVHEPERREERITDRPR